MKTPKYSIIITAWKEPITIKDVVKSLLDKKINGLNANYEVLVVCPDSETWQAAKQTADKYQFTQIKRIVDKAEGKPKALALAFKKAKGAIFVLTDGDTAGLAKDSLRELLKPFEDKKILGVSGHPVSGDQRINKFGFYSHLHCEAAHIHRLDSQKKKNYFPMSGYLYAFRKMQLDLPAALLAEDAWISAKINENGGKIAYAPEAVVTVFFPKNKKDWIKQKTRSLGGNVQMERFLQTKKTKRNLLQDLGMTFFPLKFAKNFRELVWSLLLYPLRLELWLRIFFKQKIKRENLAGKAWDRIESSKS